MSMNPITIASDFSSLGSAAAKITPSKRALIVTHAYLKRLYGPAVQKSLARAGVHSDFHLIAPGEKTKNLRTVEGIYRACVRSGLDRGSCLIILGGGVVGDTGGFAAATFLRGIPLIQIPTTLLAMVDSSIGGKTGVDLKEAKNYVGAFHQSSWVWINLETLKTLPQNEFVNGMAEVIKYGVIADAKLFETLEASVPIPKFPAQETLSRVIETCAALKINVVKRDEKETSGLREILNFGHTWGHAIETFGSYHTYSHGQAISIGMCAAGFMAVKLGLWKSEELTRMENLLSRAGLPVKLTRRMPSSPLFNILLRDKKIRQAQPRFILPVKIGKVIAKEVSRIQALEGLKYVQP